MILYSKEQTQSLHQETFAFLKVEEKNQLLRITLDRAHKKNALHPQMVNEIAFAMHYAHFKKEVWMVLLQANGNIFCAGADLKAMLGQIEENNSSIPPPKEEVLIGELFNKIHKPVIAKVTGDVYAGGFFFLAGSHIVIAQEGIKLGLPEVKRGLYPFQVMAALLKVMPSRKVIDWCIRGYNLPVREAAQYGLVTQVTTADQIDAETEKILEELRKNSPTAIQFGLAAYDKIRPAAEEHQYLLGMLMKTIGTPDGQEGLKAFREKRVPKWVGK